MGFGIVLVLIGVGTYAAAGGASVTALIPAFVGVLMLLAGFAISRPGSRPFGLYAAATLAALLGLGSLRGVIGLLGGEVALATVTQLVLLVLCLVFLVVCIREIGAGRRVGAG